MFKNFILIAALAASLNAHAKATIQNEDVKSATQIISAGGTAAQTINDSKIYDTTNSQQLSVSIANGQLGGGGGGSGIELLSNPAFETGSAITSGWSFTGGTATLLVPGNTGFLFGRKSGSFHATAVNHTFKSAAVQINGLAGAGCGAAISYTYAGTSGDYTFRVVDGSAAVLASLPLPTSTVAAIPAQIYFPCGTLTTSTLQWQLVSNVASPGTIYFDNNHLGSPNVVQVSGLIGTGWVPSTHVTFPNFGSVTNNQIMERRVGDTLEVEGTALMGTGTGGQFAIAQLTGLTIDPVKNGTANGKLVGIWTMGASSSLALYGAGVPTGQLFYDGGTQDKIFFTTSTYSNVSRVFTPVDASGVQPSPNALVTVKFKVAIATWDAQFNGLAVPTSSLAASWSGWQPGCSWTTTSASFVDPADQTCALTERSNVNFGSVVVFGSAKPGIVFTPPKTGRYNVCVTSALSNTSGPTQAGIAQLVDGSGNQISTTSSYSTPAAPAPITMCGIVSSVGGSSTTVKVQIESSLAATTTTLGGASANSAEWTIYQLDAGQPAPLLLAPPRSEVWVRIANLQGSTNTAIRRWTTVMKNVGTGIVYSDSATLGGAFTIIEDGVYSISYTDAASPAISTFGISLNSTALSTGIDSIPAGEAIAATLITGNDVYGNVSTTLHLSPGDVIRGHVNPGTTASGNTNLDSFRITQVSR